MGPALIEALTRIEHWQDRAEYRRAAAPAATPAFSRGAR
jgi:hypothetical protein